MPKKKQGYMCPEFSILLGICQLTKGICTCKNPLECDLRGDYAPLVKPKPPVVETEKPKEKKSDLPPRPRFFTIEEQLRELGVDPDTIAKTLDKVGVQGEVTEVILRKPDDPPLPEYKRPEPDLSLVEFMQSETRPPCTICQSTKWWRLKAEKQVYWRCERCHPSPESPQPKLIDGTLHNEIYVVEYAPGLRGHYEKQAPEDF